ncbi:MAG: thioredoxin family protein [Kofleriaceae bacterium]
MDDVVTLIEFTAAWCGPCRELAPVVSSIVDDDPARTRVLVVDVDDDHALATRFGVRSMPTVVLWRGGREVGRVVGTRPRRFLAGMVARAHAGELAITGP